MVNIIWGPLTGLAKLVRRSIKIVLCFFVAIILHSLAFNFLTTPELPSDVDDTGTLIVEETQAAITLCGKFDAVALDCDDPSTLIGIYIDHDVKTEKVPSYLPVLERQSSPFPFASQVAIQHSVHTLSRVYEQLAFNDSNRTASALKLCSGTLKRLGKDQCKESEKVEEAISSVLSPIVKNLRLATLLIGPIQLLTISVFLLVVFEALGRVGRWVFPKSEFLIKPKDDEGRWMLKNDEELEKAVTFYANSSVKSIQDRLVARAILCKHGDPAFSHSDSNDKSTTVDGYREFLVAEAEAKLDSLGTMNEVMLKLAFAGTVIGIAFALFSARALDAANPITEMLAKAAMFGAIGSAFGTTLLGVILSIVASVAIQFAYSTWLDGISSSFDAVVSISDDIDPALAPRYRRELESGQGDNSDSDLVEQIGWLIILLFIILAVLGVWFYWESFVHIWKIVIDQLQALIGSDS